MSEEYIGWLDEEWNTVLDQSQPLVRCRDCKYARHYTPYIWRDRRPRVEEWYCEWHSNAEGASEIAPDGFCAWGESKRAAIDNADDTPMC